MVFEKRLNEELISIKDKHNKEIESVKNNLSEIYEKERRMLKEGKEDLQIKTDSLSTQLREKQTQYEELLREGTGWQTKIENDQSELRINYRIKVEESERVRLELEELRDENKIVKNENEMLKDKIALLRSEFFKAESKASQDSADLKAGLAVAKEQLKNYECIENEVDEAILQMGSSPGETDNIYLNTIQYAPTSTKRRVQQSLSLAKQLQSKQDEIHKLRTLIQSSTSESDSTKQELLMVKNLLDQTKQPSAYLIDTLEEKERLLIELKKRLHTVENDLDFTRQNYGDLEGRYRDCEMKLKGLQVKRGNIENIQNIMLNMIDKNSF
jgi:progesterone-induced-blocking factor 1